MIKFLFLSIPSNDFFYFSDDSTYDSLKNTLTFKEDIYGVSTWTLKHPLTIYSADLQYKHIFNLNEVKIEPASSVNLEQKWKYFVITKEDGGKYYCTSQIIYEKGMLKTYNQQHFFSNMTNHSNILTEFYLPKCIVIISELPYFKLQVNLLKIHKQLKKKQPAISYCIQQDLYQLYIQLVQTGRQKQWENLNLNQIKSKKTYCPIQLSFSYYIQCCNIHNSGECIYIQKGSSREVLHLYKLHPSSLYQIGYFFHLPFSPYSLRKIISAILSEKQIVFSSSNQNLTVMVIETLMQMILPLKWCYMYAPNLPIELLQAAQESFMPYIVGINKQYLHLINKSNKVIVHIDNDTVNIQEEQVHMLSKKFQKYLTLKSNSNKEYLEWEKQLRINSIMLITTIFKDNTSIFSNYKSNSNQNEYLSQSQRQSQKLFYEQFLQKSMMYRKLIQDIHENVYNEFYKLTRLDPHQRKLFLISKFNSLHTQTIYPLKFDNKKKWIKFYQKYNRNKRKSRFSRHSISMVEPHNFLTNSNIFYGSNASLAPNQSRLSHIFPNNNTNNNVLNFFNYQNQRSSSLFQSQIRGLGVSNVNQPIRVKQSTPINYPTYSNNNYTLNSIPTHPPQNNWDGNSNYMKISSTNNLSYHQQGNLPFNKTSSYPTLNTTIIL